MNNGASKSLLKPAQILFLGMNHQYRHTRRAVLCATLFFSALIISLNYATAGEADVLDAKVRALGNGQFRIDVTVEHADDGWHHYANRWDVLGPDGQLIGERVLLHPHDNEQPFTRSLTLAIPDDVSAVTLQANDSVHGLGGATITLEIPRS